MNWKIAVLMGLLSSGCTTDFSMSHFDAEADADAVEDVGVVEDGHEDAVEDGNGEDIIEDPVEDAAEDDVAPDSDVPVYVMGNPGEDCTPKCAELGLGCLGRGSVGLDCGEHLENSTCLLENCWVWMDLSPPEGRGNCGSTCGECNVCNRNDDVNYSFCCECG